VLTLHAKQFIADAMYEKGKAFVGAALLVDQKDGHPAVVLHLLCQGIEIILKALLLRHDYAHYKPRLKKLGHDLPKVAAAARKATGFHLFTHRTHDELAELSKFYQEHLLRYASNFDIFIDPRTIPSRRVFRHCGALIKFLEQRAHFK
jgi:hypothetical protein